MHQLWLIPVLPLAGFLINGLFGRKLPKAAINVVAIGSVLLSFLWVLKTISALGDMNDTYVEHYFTWIKSGFVDVSLDFAVDRLTAVMLMIVTGVGLLIHIYSIGYMGHEGGYYRYFSYLNLFMFYMLTLVLAANYLVLFVGWEGVGLASYLLIGFYFVKKSASDAGKKAFVVNRIGDFGFSLAMFMIMVHFGSLDFAKVFEKAGSMPAETSGGIITLICILLMVGATGKSAQVPLYVWLPDAMQGPTPVSALIHAATMVTAGVYMVARSAVLFDHAPIAMDIVAYVGTITLILSAIIGMTQWDIKKVFAYSTVSQLGYMFLGLGSGVYQASIFHVMTHAFFKATLFLGAGSLIHALSGEQDMRMMGGLRKKLPVSFFILLCGALAISGVPPFAAYFSKDMILEGSYVHHPYLFWVGVITAGFTAFYVFRAIFHSFFGEYRGNAHPHESPVVMLAPACVLAILSLVGGFIPVPEFLTPMFGHMHLAHEWYLRAVSVGAAFLGIGSAWLFCLAKPAWADSLTKRFSGLYNLIYHKFLVDEAYDAMFVHPIRDGSDTVLFRGVDVGVIDGAVNGSGTLMKGIGGQLRHLQSGFIRRYAAWVVAGGVALVAVVSLWGGLK
jgi:NADH-quinone oxidoreductase subunit L